MCGVCASTPNLSRYPSSFCSSSSSSPSCQEATCSQICDTCQLLAGISPLTGKSQVFLADCVRLSRQLSENLAHVWAIDFVDFVLNPTHHMYLHLLLQKTLGWQPHIGLDREILSLTTSIAKGKDLPLRTTKDHHSSGSFLSSSKALHDHIGPQYLVLLEVLFLFSEWPPTLPPPNTDSSASMHESQMNA